MRRILRRCPKCDRWFGSSAGKRGRPRVECVECNPKSGGELEGDPRADGFVLRRCTACGRPFKTDDDCRRSTCLKCAARIRADKERAFARELAIERKEGIRA